MREIDKLIEDIILNEEDCLDIEEVPLEEEEYQAVKNKTIHKIGLLQKEEKSGCVKSKKKIKHVGKKVKIFLIAAVLMTSATTLIAGIRNGTVEEIFSVILGKSALNIGGSGIILDGSDSEEGITVSLGGALADENTINLLVDLEKENSKAFKGENIKFDQLTLELEGEEKIDAGGVTSWWEYDIVEKIKDEPSKRTLQLKRGSIEGIEGKTATLIIEDITEYRTLDTISQVTLNECFNKKEDSLEEVILNKDRRYNEKLIEMGDEQEIAFKESIPQYLIPAKGLDIMLFSEVPELKLDNIGFVDGQLQMRIKGSDSTIHLKDEKGDSLEPLYTVKQSNYYAYYVYPISSLEELKGVRCFITIDQELNKIEGKWQISFNIDTNSEKKVIELDMEVPLTNIRTIEAKQIELSQLSLEIIYKEDESVLKYPDIIFVFEDGTEKLISDKEVYINIQSGGLRQCIYDFDEPINLEQIEAIRINDSIVSLR